MACVTAALADAGGAQSPLNGEACRGFPGLQGGWWEALWGAGGLAETHSGGGEPGLSPQSCFLHLGPETILPRFGISERPDLDLLQACL